LTRASHGKGASDNTELERGYSRRNDVQERQVNEQVEMIDVVEQLVVAEITTDQVGCVSRVSGLEARPQGKVA